MDITKVVIGIDFSDASLGTARWATRDFAPDATAILVYVIDLPTAPGFLRRLLPAPTELAGMIEDSARARLLVLQQELAPARTNLDLRTGAADAAIAQAASDARADVIVVGGHGHTGPLGSLLGTTAEKLVRRASVPVLVARNLPAARPSVILVPIDESAHAGPVLAWAKLLQERFDAELVLLHAVDPRVSGRVRLVSTLPRADALENQLLAAADAWLEEQALTAGLPVQRTRRVLRLGDAAFEIPAVERSHNAELIVMGSRGAGAASTLLLGSVAAQTLRSAGCSVLVVPAPDAPDAPGGAAGQS